MSKIVLDTSAWVEYFNGTEKGVRVKEWLKESSKVLITGMIVAELSAKFLRESKPVDEMVFALKNRAELMGFDFELERESARIYIQQRKIRSNFSLVDAHVVAAARIIGGKIVTCDEDFRNLPEAIIIR